MNKGLSLLSPEINSLRGQRIKQKRESLKINIFTMANETNFNPLELNDIECGRRGLTKKTQVMFENYFKKKEALRDYSKFMKSGFPDIY